MLKLALVLQLACLALAYRPLLPNIIPQHPAQGDVGEPLYLTPYIERGDIATARSLAEVTDPLVGLEFIAPQSFSGFLSVKPDTDNNMFFWFFPALEADPSEAPVVIWLQGGPGGSSMFGLLEIHGPISSVYNSDGDVTGVLNQYTWANHANMLYIDNPVGAGFSYSDNNGLPTTQEDVANDLYEFLQQWYQLFPEYQSNPFYAFGESYGGKFVPTIAKKIHDENQNNPLIPINLAGIGVGDGFMSPPDSSIYADYLYQVGLVDDNKRDQLLNQEQKMKEHVANEEWIPAWNAWNVEFSLFLGAMGCNYYYEITICQFSEVPEEENYSEYVQLDANRKALHVGDLSFGAQSGDVYNSMLNDFMRSERANVEFLLDNYSVLIYDGNLDIICNHPGILEMFNAMQDWSAIDEYHEASNEVWRFQQQTAGYLKSVQNLRMFVMRNAGHMVPRSQPLFAEEMFRQFINGEM